MGVSFSKEFFTNVGDTSFIMELVFETQTIGSTTFDFENIENTTTEGLDEVLEAEELTIWRVHQVALNEKKYFWLPYHWNIVVWAFFHLNKYAIYVDVKNPQMMWCVSATQHLLCRVLKVQ